MTKPIYQILLMALLGLSMLTLLGCGSVQILQVNSPLPVDFPEDSFSHKSFEKLLQQFVDDGSVDYEAWHENTVAMNKFNAYIAALAAYSPENAPQRFKDVNDAKAYWLYAYNAFVIKAVLDRWPLEKVTDVKAPLEIVEGYGFFYQLQFITGGKAYNLYDIEHEKVFAQWEDPRAHFVLNCASSSCPVIRPELPTGAELEPFLAEATLKFVSEKKNVSVDHQERVLRLSKIFKWYEDDFLNDLRRRSIPSPNGILDYIIDVSPAERHTELKSAMNYIIVYYDYDWTLNRSAKERTP